VQAKTARSPVRPLRHG